MLKKVKILATITFHISSPPSSMGDDPDPPLVVPVFLGIDHHNVST